jgi:hypothetical protein
MLSEQVEYPEVICPARILFEGFVLVGARHSDPLWRLARLNAEYATVGDQSLPFSGQLSWLEVMGLLSACHTREH